MCVRRRPISGRRLPVTGDGCGGGAINVQATSDSLAPLFLVIMFLSAVAAADAVALVRLSSSRGANLSLRAA